MRIWFISDIDAEGLAWGGYGYLMPMSEFVGLPWYIELPDLNGYTIERFGMTIDSASYTVDYSRTQPHIYNWQVTFTIEGVPTVPEPASLTTMLAGAGWLGLGMLRKRRSLMNTGVIC